MLARVILIVENHNGISYMSAYISATFASYMIRVDNMKIKDIAFLMVKKIMDYIKVIH